VIATNTSTLSVTELARATAYPGRVLGLHFFVPAHASKLLEIVRLGWLGQKAGRGFYRYLDGSWEAIPDPEVDRLIEKLAAERGITRRRISDEEIVERCLLSLVNAGAIVLEEGIAALP